MSDYSSLIRHMEWADSQIWRSVLNLSSSEQDEWMKERLHHFHSTQWCYGQILLSLPVEIPDLSSFPDLKSIGLWARRFYREMAGDLSCMNELKLRQTVEFPWAAEIAKRIGSAVPATVSECILQLALHTAHHRGQVAMRVRQTGIEPPMTDFIAWVWMKRPAPDWGSLENDR